VNLKTKFPITVAKTCEVFATHIACGMPTRVHIAGLVRLEDGLGESCVEFPVEAQSMICQE
jgi:hypothetical protein